MAVKSLNGLTGEEIAQIAYAQHSIKPSGLGAVCEVLIYVFGVICTVVVCLRAYVRTFRVKNDQKWRLNDYLAVIGFVRLVPITSYRRQETQLTSFSSHTSQQAFSASSQSTTVSAQRTQPSTPTPTETSSQSAAWNT